MSKRICEWLFILHAAACLVTLGGAAVFGIAGLFDAGIVFAGSMVIFYMLSRVAR